MDTGDSPSVPAKPPRSRQIEYARGSLRWLSCFVLAIILVTVGITASAVAKPRVAIAPLDGDSDDKISDVIAEEAGKSAKVTPPDEVGKIIESLGIRDLHSMRALKKLRVRLEVDAIVYGKLERQGSKKRLKLTVSGRAKKAVSFEVEFKTSSSKTFRKGLRDELATHIATATEGEAYDDDTDDDDEPKKKKLTEDDEPKKKKLTEDDEPKNKHDDGAPKQKHDDERPKKRVAADDDSARVRKHHDDDGDDDQRKTHKKKRRHRDDDAEPAGRHPTTQAALWLDAGATGVRRTLTYDTTDVTTPPPRVGTGAAAAQFEGEVYPLALSGSGGSGAGFGLALAVRKTVGLSIAVPGTNVSAGIKEGQYSIGPRYRFMFGTTTLAIGVDYWRRYDYADRSALAMPGLLDMPDVEYTAVAPGAVVKVAATLKIALFLGLQVPAMLGTGPIGAGGSYGKATAVAFEAHGGLDVELATNYGVRFAAMFEQVGLAFKADPGTLAARRQVAAVTDRTMGISATFAVFY